MLVVNGVYMLGRYDVFTGGWMFWPQTFRSRTFWPRTLRPQTFWPHLFPGADVSAKRVKSALLSLIFPSHHPPSWVCALPYSSEAHEQCSSFIHLSLPPPPEFVPFLTAQKRVNSALLSFICAMLLVFWLFMIAVSLHRVQSIRHLAYLLSHNGNNKYIGHLAKTSAPVTKTS